jgi:integron integrase
MVLTREEVFKPLVRLDGTNRIIGSILYGSGLRLLECLRLRVKDIDFGYSSIHVHEGKGRKDRIVVLPKQLHRSLKDHLHEVHLTHETDLDVALGKVYLPDSIARKYKNAAAEWKWQYWFSSTRSSKDPRSTHVGRHHIHITTFQKVMRRAVVASGITKQASSHTLRHSFAPHALENGMDIRTVKQQLGHSSLETTEIYTHVLKRGGQAVRSPLEDIFPSDGGVDLNRV